jgi:hypothetical protein
MIEITHAKFGHQARHRPARGGSNRHDFSSSSAIPATYNHNDQDDDNNDDNDQKGSDIVVHLKDGADTGQT